MTKINLKSKTREVTGRKVNKYREEGLIPAVVYGHKLKPRNLLVNFLDFKKVYEKAGENIIIDLEIDGKDKVSVLIHDTQMDPLSDKFSHIDFFQIRMDEKIEADIPIEFTGDSPAVKEQGGVLVKSLEEVAVSCLPTDLPSKFTVDLSVLKSFDDYVKIKDIEVSEKVKILIDSDTIIATTTPPRSEEEMAKLDEKVEEDVSKVEGVVKEESDTTEESGESKDKEEPKEKQE